MFSNIGGKIKGLAKFVCWAGIVLSILLGILTMVGSSQINYSYSYGSYNSSSSGMGILSGLLIIVVGGLSSWLGSLALYGFGELIDNTSYIASKVSSLGNEGKPSLSQVAPLNQSHQDPR